jgi:hypothetical protein
MTEIFNELSTQWARAGCPNATELAREIEGISHVTVGNYVMHGDIRRLPTLLKIVDALDGDREWFITKWGEGLAVGEAAVGPRRQLHVQEDILEVLKRIEQVVTEKLVP